MFVCSSNEENLTTLYNNAVELDVAVKAVVNITLTGSAVLSHGHALISRANDDGNDNIKLQF